MMSRESENGERSEGMRMPSEVAACLPSRALAGKSRDLL